MNLFSSLRPALLDMPGRRYSFQSFMHDLFAGLIVGVVALPLSIAFAIASGVKPEQGLVTAVVAGFLISFFSGSRVQIGGPTGAFIVILAGIVGQYGYDGLAVATLMAGILLVVMAAAQFGDVIKFIPYPVTIGFTSGIALVIFTTQIPDALGLRIEHIPGHFLPKWVCYGLHLKTVNPYSVALMLITVLIVIYWPRITHKIPGTLIAILTTTVITHLFNFPVDTIGSRFGEIQNHFPMPHLPKIDLASLPHLIAPAFSIAVLAGIESLLSAVVADGMTGTKHRSNAELLAQGIANIVSPLFGGIPATGAIARTATNIKNNGHSPLAGIIHAVTILVIFLFFGSQAAAIPMATLAGILFIVSWNMSEYSLFLKLLKAPRSDVLVLLTTFGLTVLVDLTVAIEAGMVLAAFLFMRRMILVTQTTAITAALCNGEYDPEDPEATSRKDIPDGIEIFEINGPFFFGAAEKFKNTLREMKRFPKVLILRMRHVPMIDATGIKALEEIIHKHFHEQTAVILSGVQQEVQKSLENARFTEKIGRENIVSDIDQALRQAREVLNRNP